MDPGGAVHYNGGMSEQAPHPAMAISDYIDAMACHVSSVCVVTTEHDGKRYGFTATAVSSVSAEPPRLLVCVNKRGFTHDRILEAGRFCVNVLSESQDQIAMVFAAAVDKATDRFKAGRWGVLETGAPALDGAAAVFDCVLGEVSDQSTHSLMFGDVVSARGRAGVDTLLYGGRRFRQLRKVIDARSAEGEEYPEPFW